jgi:ectoine hydroxylase-related dioxygenase (phytanoyl-CoA dioxygenase family)
VDVLIPEYKKYCVDFSTTSDEKISDVWNEYGFVLVKNLLPFNDLKNLLDDIDKILASRLSSLGIKNHPNSIDLMLKALYEIEPKCVREVIIAIRDLPSFYALVIHPNILCMVSNLLGSNLPHAVHDVCMMRIDSSFDKRRSFDWHQEYPYILGSNPGLTAWAPILSVDSEMGPLEVIPKSHLEIRPILIHEENTKGKDFTGQAAMSIEHLTDQETDTRVYFPNMDPGDVLLLNGLCIHRSGQNVSSDKARWVLLPRYSDGLAPELVSNGWRVARDKVSHWDLFKERHPDLIK